MSARGHGLGVRAVAALAVAACAAAVLAGAGPAPGDGAPALATQTLTRLPDGRSAVFATAAPGVENRLYVASLDGSIYSIDLAAADPSPVRLMRIPPRRLLHDADEQGLLSVAFAPDFAESGRFYAYFVNRRGDIELDEYRASSPTVASPRTRREVLTIPHRRAYNHNGGTAAFGPGGHLFIGTGDGSNAGDEFENAQDRRLLLGKLLRIDPRRSGPRPYTVPRSNPFSGEIPGRREILALGLRNPFRFSFDGRVAWIGDVGQYSWEEIDRAPARGLRGANFGWDRWEGTHRYIDPGGDDSAPRPSAAGHTAPVFEYPHDNGRCSVTGGVVAPPTAPAAIAGRYLFADLCGGLVRTLGSDPNATQEPTDAALSFPTSFAVGPDGEVYATQLGGEIVRFVGAPG
ncbi:glucose dehydrogenase [Thermoleophilia bacterium SCSIO 60948]|nr:glucose dehydrogenase [Thermoleophilia bacterium SCSIO 60948]